MPDRITTRPDLEAAIASYGLTVTEFRDADPIEARLSDGTRLLGAKEGSAANGGVGVAMLRQVFGGCSAWTKAE